MLGAPVAHRVARRTRRDPESSSASFLALSRHKERRHAERGRVRRDARAGAGPESAGRPDDVVVSETTRRRRRSQQRAKAPSPRRRPPDQLERRRRVARGVRPRARVSPRDARVVPARVRVQAQRARALRTARIHGSQDAPGPLLPRPSPPRRARVRARPGVQHPIHGAVQPLRGDDTRARLRDASRGAHAHASRRNLGMLRAHGATRGGQLRARRADHGDVRPDRRRVRLAHAARGGDEELDLAGAHRDASGRRGGSDRGRRERGGRTRF